MNYKEYTTITIGYSDWASLYLETSSGEKAQLEFFVDGCYSAHMVDKQCEIPEHYYLQGVYHGTLSIFSDNLSGLKIVPLTDEDEIRVYRAGDFGCIIQTFGENTQEVIESKDYEEICYNGLGYGLSGRCLSVWDEDIPGITGDGWTAHGKLWFALMTDNEDNDCGCGEASIATAIERLKKMHEDGHEEAYIAIVDDYSGDCIGEIR